MDVLISFYETGDFPALTVAGSSYTNHYEQPPWSHCIKKFDITAYFKKSYLHINNCKGYWPSCLALPTNHHYVERGKRHLHMHTSRMQMHFSASIIRSVLHSLHMFREQCGILIWSLQRYGAHSMQLKPPGQSIHVSSAAGVEGRKMISLEKHHKNQLEVIVRLN